MIAKVKITGVCAETIWSKPIPKGIVGAQVELEYDASWAGLKKTVVFMGDVSRDVIDATGVVRIPQEVVATSGCSLFVGVYGTDADDIIAIPTLWAGLGIVRESADPSGDLSTAPQLPVWAQLLAMIGQIGDLETEAKNNLVAAVNELARRSSGLPAFGTEDEGKLLFVQNGAARSVELGKGLEIVEINGRPTLRLTVVPDTGEPEEITVQIVDGTIRVSTDIRLDEAGTILVSAPVIVAEDGTIIIGGDNNG